MTDDPKKLDPRAVILARRAHFVAAAMASITIACGKQERPEVCLSVVTVPNDGSAPPGAGSDAVDAQAQPLLPDPTTTDASPPSPPDAGRIEDAGALPPPKRDAGGHSPHPCLRAPPPRPCLKVAPR